MSDAVPSRARRCMCGRSAWMRASFGNWNAAITSCFCTIGGTSSVLLSTMVVFTCVCTGVVANFNPIFDWSVVSRPIAL